MSIMLDTLNHMAKLDRINDLVFCKIRKSLGSRIVEAGCGNGNLTAQMLDKELVVAIDNDEAMLQTLRSRFGGNENVTISNVDLAGPDFRKFRSYKPDTILCMNTLEHIRDDKAVLDNFNAILDSGTLIIIVPAFQFLFSPIDKAAGHYRRYNMTELALKAEGAGFTVSRKMYANLFGIAGWLVNGKILRRDRLSKGLLSLFDFMIPFFEMVEGLTGPPVGLSIIMICEKKG
jgi:SAM-dependent methyltransferase